MTRGYCRAGGATRIACHYANKAMGRYDEICYGIPGSKKTFYISATTSITLRRGQEILAGDCNACYKAIKKEEALQVSLVGHHGAARSSLLPFGFSG